MCDTSFLKSDLFLRCLLDVLIICARYEVLAAVLTKIQVMCDMTSYTLVFRHLCLHDAALSYRIIEAV